MVFKIILKKLSIFMGAILIITICCSVCFVLVSAICFPYTKILFDQVESAFQYRFKDFIATHEIRDDWKTELWYLSEGSLFTSKDSVERERIFEEMMDLKQNERKAFEREKIKIYSIKYKALESYHNINLLVVLMSVVFTSMFIFFVITITNKVNKSLKCDQDLNNRKK